MRFWKRLNPDGTTRTVESYSHDYHVVGATEILDLEFDEFIDKLPVIITLPNIRECVKAIESRLEALEKKIR